MSQEAFTQLVDAYYQALYRFALSLTRSEADASDLTQQTFYVWQPLYLMAILAFHHPLYLRSLVVLNAEACCSC